MLTRVGHTFDASPGQVMDSPAFTTGVAGSVLVKNGTLVVNGVVRATPFSVLAADSLVLRHTSSDDYQRTVWTTLELDTTSWSWASTTRTKPSWENLPAYENVSVLDISTYPNGYPFDPLKALSLSKTLRFINSEGYNTAEVYPVNAGQPLDYQDTEVVYWTSFYDDRVYPFHVTDKQYLPFIQLPAGCGPYGIGYWTRPTDKALILLTTGYHSNKVYFIGTQHELLNSLNANGPTGIWIDNTNARAWVCESASNSVLQINLTTMTSVRIQLGHRPWEIVGDDSGNVVITTSDDMLCHVTPAGVVTTVSTGGDPWAITFYKNKFYVACSYTNELRIYDLALTEINQLDVGNLPYNVQVTDTDIFVACMGTATVERYSAVNLMQLAVLECGSYPYGLVLDSSNNLFVSVLNSGVPRRAQKRDYVPDRFSIKTIYGVPDQSYVSEPISVINFYEGTQVQVSVPDVQDAVLYVNGAQQAVKSVLCNNGDRVQVGYRAGSTYDSVTMLPLTVGGFENVLKIKVPALSVEPNPVRFQPVLGLGLDADCMSNAVTIHGLSEGLTVDLSADCAFLVNGAQHAGGTTTQVKTGDVVVLVGRSPSQWGTPQVYRVWLDGLTTTWLIATSSVVSHVVDLPDIPDQFDLARSITVTSAQVQVLIETFDDNGTQVSYVETAEIIPSGFGTDGILLKNGTPVGAATTVIRGDRLSVRVDTGSNFYESSWVYVKVGGAITVFEARTVPDVSPDTVELQPVYESVPRGTYVSTPFTVTGISGPDVPIELQVPFGIIVVNGEFRGATTTVLLGDRVEWILKIHGPFSGNNNYTATYGDTTFTWSFYNVSLIGPVRDQMDYGSVTNLRGQWVLDYTDNKHEATLRPAFHVPRADGAEVQPRSSVPAKVQLGESFSSMLAMTVSQAYAEYAGLSATSYAVTPSYGSERTAELRRQSQPAMVQAAQFGVWRTTAPNVVEIEQAQWIVDTDSILTVPMVPTKFSLLGREHQLQPSKMSLRTPVFRSAAARFLVDPNHAWDSHAAEYRIEVYRKSDAVMRYGRPLSVAHQATPLGFGKFNCAYAGVLSAAQASQHGPITAFGSRAGVSHTKTVSFAAASAIKVERNVAAFPGLVAHREQVPVKDLGAVPTHVYATEELALQQASVDGFTEADAVPFGAGFVYRGLCVTRIIRNLSGWIQGG